MRIQASSYPINETGGFCNTIRCRAHKIHTKRDIHVVTHPSSSARTETKCVPATRTSRQRAVTRLTAIIVANPLCNCGSVFFLSCGFIKRARPYLAPKRHRAAAADGDDRDGLRFLSSGIGRVIRPGADDRGGMPRPRCIGPWAARICQYRCVASRHLPGGRCSRRGSADPASVEGAGGGGSGRLTDV